MEKYCHSTFNLKVKIKQKISNKWVKNNNNIHTQLLLIDNRLTKINDTFFKQTDCYTCNNEAIMPAIVWELRTSITLILSLLSGLHAYYCAYNITRMLQKKMNNKPDSVLNFVCFRVYTYLVIFMYFTYIFRLLLCHIVFLLHSFYVYVYRAAASCIIN